MKPKWWLSKPAQSLMVSAYNKRHSIRNILSGLYRMVKGKKEEQTHCCTCGVILDDEPHRIIRCSKCGMYAHKECCSWEANSRAAVCNACVYKNDACVFERNE